MSKRPYKFKVYQFEVSMFYSEWGWALHAPNGRIIANSHENYATRQHAVRSARDVMTAIQTADITCP